MLSDLKGRLSMTNVGSFSENLMYHFRTFGTLIYGKQVQKLIFKIQNSNLKLKLIFLVTSVAELAFKISRFLS